MRGFIAGIVVGLIAGAVAVLVLMPPPKPPPPPDNPLEHVTAELPRGEEVKARWRLASQFPADFPVVGALASENAGVIETMSHGVIHFDVREPGSDTPPLKLFDMVGTGTIEAAFGSPTYWRDSAPAIALFGGIPFGPNVAEYLAWYQRSGRDLHDELYHAANVHGLACGLIPGGASWFRGEFKDKRVLDRVQVAASGLAGYAMAGFGAHPLRVAPGDLAAAIRKGTVAGGIGLTPLSDRAALRTSGARHAYFPAWQAPVQTLELIVNLDAWRALPDGQRQVLETVCAGNMAAGLGDVEAVADDALKDMMKDGLDIRRLPQPVIDALNAGWQDASAKLVRDDQDFARLWRSLAAFREDYALARELSTVPQR